MPGMIWKKNAFSYGLWSAYLLGAGVLFVYGAIIAAGRLGWNNQVGAGVLTGLGLAAVFLVFLLIGRFAGSSRFFYVKSQTGLILEILLVVGLFAVGGAFRIANISYAGEEAAYYDMARVTQGSEISQVTHVSEIPQVTHGATYFYLQLLRGLFLLLGNKWMAGIWLQIGLQLLGCLLLFLGVRRLAGRVPAVIMTVFFLLTPDKIAEGLLYSPKMLYMCFYGVGLLLVSLFLSKCARSGKKTVYDRLFGFVLGLFPGLVCYLDITGATLLLAAASVLYLRKGEESGKYCLPELLSFLLGAVVSFCVCLVLNAFASGRTMAGVVKAWLGLYEVKGWNAFFWLPEGGVQPTYYFLSVLLIFGIFSYWRREKNEKLGPWILMSLGLAVMECFRMTTDSMSGKSLLYWIFAVMAGIAATECFTHVHGRKTFQGEKVPVEAIEMEEKLSPEEFIQIELEDTAKIEGTAEKESEDTSEPEEAMNIKAVEDARKKPEDAQKSKFIDNPLPLPKKHVKKVMDYSFELEESKMTFDVEIPDDDDFDIT